MYECEKRLLRPHRLSEPEMMVLKAIRNVPMGRWSTDGISSAGKCPEIRLGPLEICLGLISNQSVSYRGTLRKPALALQGRHYLEFSWE